MNLYNLKKTVRQVLLDNADIASYVGENIIAGYPMQSTAYPCIALLFTGSDAEYTNTMHDIRIYKQQLTVYVCSQGETDIGTIWSNVSEIIHLVIDVLLNIDNYKIEDSPVVQVALLKTADDIKPEQEGDPAICSVVFEYQIT